MSRLLLALLVAMAVPAGAADAVLHGLTLNDHLGKPHDLDRESRSALVMLFDLQARVDAKAWDEGVSPSLPVDRQLVRVLDGGAIEAADRARLSERVTKALEGTGVAFVFDWDGAVRKRLGATTEALLLIAFDEHGGEVGRIGGLPTAASRTKALAFLAIVPDPPLTDRVVPNTKTDPRRTP